MRSASRHGPAVNHLPHPIPQHTRQHQRGQPAAFVLNQIGSWAGGAACQHGPGLVDLYGGEVQLQTLEQIQGLKVTLILPAAA